MAAHHSHGASGARLNGYVAEPTRQAISIDEELPHALNRPRQEAFESNHGRRLKLTFTLIASYLSCCVFSCF
jgi:hypothetical protein